MMKRVFLTIFLGLTTLYGYEQGVHGCKRDVTSCEALLQEEKVIDGQIHQLHGQFEYYRAKAERLEEMGDRLQYQGNHAAAEAKWQAAKEYEEMTIRVEKDLARLQAQKQEIDAKLKCNCN